MYRALQLDLRYEFVVEYQIRDYRYSNHKKCRGTKEKDTQVRSLGFLGDEGLEARYHRVLVIYSVSSRAIHKHKTITTFASEKGKTELPSSSVAYLNSDIVLSVKSERKKYWNGPSSAEKARFDNLGDRRHFTYCA